MAAAHPGRSRGGGRWRCAASALCGEEGGRDEGDVVQRHAAAVKARGAGEAERPHRLVASIAFLVFSLAIWT